MVPNHLSQNSHIFVNIPPSSALDPPRNFRGGCPWGVPPSLSLRSLERGRGDLRKLTSTRRPSPFPLLFLCPVSFPPRYRSGRTYNVRIPPRRIPPDL